MHYAVSNWIYGDEPLEDVFKRLQRYGFDGIELVSEPERYNVQEVRRLSEAYQIRVCSVLSWCLANIPGRDPAHPDPAERHKAADYLARCVDFAAEVGAPIVVVLPAPAGRTAPVGIAMTEAEWEAGYRREWQAAVEGTHDLAGYAREKNITLAIEPLNRYESFLVTNLQTARRFIQDVQATNVKVHLDTFHMSIEERDLAGVVREAGELLVNMHVSDSNRETPGRGNTDFAGIVKSLREISYAGYLVLEPVPPGSNPVFDATRPGFFHLRDDYAREGIQFLKNLAGED
jgi:sugar phosphate isomerase/epimerase